jgi:hypothetical protein
MKFTLQYSGKFFEIKIAGPANSKKYEEVFDTLFMHEKWKLGAPLLFDETELDSSKISVDDVHRIAAICTQRKTKFGASRCALIVSRDLEYGMNRMWMVFVEDEWDVTVGLFRSRDEAISWLAAEQNNGTDA